MEELEEFVFKKLDFELPFYFRYNVDDSILCNLYTNFKFLLIASIVYIQECSLYMKGKLTIESVF